jgi:Fic family protein
LIDWYRQAEQKGKLSVVALATMFHFRYIRIHPFEDGNGRIARLLVNYILLRHNYPMIVIPAADRQNYLAVLGKCDDNAGRNPSDGANATLGQVQPLVDYLSGYIEKKITLAVQLAKGEISTIKETKNDTENDIENDTEQLTDREMEIIALLQKDGAITRQVLAGIVRVGTATISRTLESLRRRGLIERVGGDKGGYWKVIK